MRILQVVTLVTPDGSYGGPLRVALNQCASLRRAGHEVTLAAGASGFTGPLPRTFAEEPVTLFPAVPALPGTGFAGITSPRLLRWIHRRAGDFDVAHVHLTRDLVGLPASLLLRRRGLPFVAQTHGMIDPSNHPLSVPLDAVLTRRALRGAARILHLTDVEREGLLSVDPTLTRLATLPNGVPIPDQRADPGAAEPDVLYLARLAPRKRPEVFVAAAQRLARRHLDATFSIVGPDEGMRPRLETMLTEDDAGGRIRLEGSLPPADTLDRLAAAAVYVLPAIDEPYPMSVLEAMSVGLPSIVLADCGLAPIVAESGAPVVTDRSVEALAKAIDDLLADAPARARIGRAARAVVEQRASMTAVRASLERIYTSAAGREAP